MEIHYDSQDLNAQLRAHAEAFAAKTNKPEAALAVHQKLDTTFQLIVLGDFKRGKSTVINALLGAAVAPVDVTPETCTVNCFDYAPSPSFAAELADGGKITLTADQLKREKLEPILSQHPVRRLRIAMPVEFLRGVTLVDTPGLGEGNELDQLVRDYLKDADAVVYVVSATSPLSQSEQEFLQQSVAPLEFPKLCFVVNFLDLCQSQDDITHVLNSIRAKLARTFPQAPLFGISAFDECSRLCGGARTKLDFSSYFAAFREHLNSSILFNRGLLITDRAASIYQRQLVAVQHSIADRKSAIAQSREQLDARIAALTTQQHSMESSLQGIQSKLKSGMDSLASSTNVWMTDFFHRLDNECIAKLTGLDLSRVRKHLPLFLSDRIRSAIEACLDAQHSQIAALLKNACQDLADAVPNEKELASRLALQPSVVGEPAWTQMDLFSLAARIINLDEILQLLVSIFRSLDRESHTNEMIGALRAKLPGMRDEVMREVARIYQQMTAEITAHLKETYQREIGSVLDALRAVQDSGARTAQTDQQMLAGLQSLQSYIDSELAFVSDLRQKTWAN